MEEKTKPNVGLLPGSILLASVIIGGAILLKDKKQESVVTEGVREVPVVLSESEGDETLEIPLDDIGAKLVSVGALNKEAFLLLYSGIEREEARRLVETKGTVTLSKKNSGILLNLLWGLGLSQKSAVLEKGKMQNPMYGGPGRFASTAGWSIAEGDPISPVRDRDGSERASVSNGMNHYSHHLFMSLSPEQEVLVRRVASGIYRPCCDNATDFPDCNHGMAMLGLLELLASKGASEEELYRSALIANRLWFSEQYAVVDRYVAGQGGGQADARTLLGKTLISASGFARVAQAVQTPSARQEGSGGGCSVSSLLREARPTEQSFGQVSES